MSIGERIKRCRRIKGLTQTKLSELLNISTMTVRRWEWGERKPDIDIMCELARVLDTTTAYLLGETDSSSPDKNNVPSGNEQLIIKNSEYQDKTAIQDSTPSMAYWGSLIDNAEIAAEKGKNLDVITGLVRKALEILTLAMPVTNISQHTEHNIHIA